MVDIKKLKSGMKVRVMNIKEGSLDSNDVYFNDEMIQYIGRVLVVDKIYKKMGWVNLVGNGWTWSPEWLTIKNSFIW